MEDIPLLYLTASRLWQEFSKFSQSFLMTKSSSYCAMQTISVELLKNTTDEQRPIFVGVEQNKQG